MPNKNIIIQIFQMAIGIITKFSVLITFGLNWGIILVRHRRASTSGAIINQRLQTAGIKYQSKNFPLTNSTEIINTSRNNHNSLNIKANNQFGFRNSIYHIIIYSSIKIVGDRKII
jgi:hypothetical protein